MAKQKTLRRAVELEGIGLHTGAATRLELRPAPPGSGIEFVRTDLPGEPRIRASIENLQRLPRRTAIGANGAQVHTVEHLLATLCAFGVTNAEARLNGPELPGMDGSALAFVAALREAGVETQDAEIAAIVVSSSLGVRENGASAVAMPADGGADGDRLRIAYTLDYAGSIGTQYLEIALDEETFAREIAPARTFCLAEEVDALRAAGLGKGASTSNTLVFQNGSVLENELRFPDEFVRHKMLDLIGDLYLAGRPIRGAIHATKSGHELNVRLTRELLRREEAGAADASRAAESKPPAAVVATADADDPFQGLEGTLAHPMDVRAIEKVLPHRYPFLLVDRVLEIRDGNFARGLKSVSYNEEFFRGHFPGHPVMPGVLVVEAMAQLAGIMLLSLREHRGQTAYLLSLDAVKFRRPVVPGDALILEADLRLNRARSARVSTRALVDGKVAAEAEIRYALIPQSS